MRFLAPFVPKVLFSILIAVIVAASYFLGRADARVGSPSVPAMTAELETAKTRFSQALELVELNHVDRVLDEQTIDSMLDAALSTLDPYSGFLDTQATDQVLHASGTQGVPRLGLSVMDIAGAYIIEAIMPDSPAAAAGFLPGDRVLRINDRYVGDEAPTSINHQLQAEMEKAQSRAISIGVRREGTPGEITLVAHPKALTPVGVFDLGVIDGVLHLHLERFYEGAAQDLSDAINRRLRDGALAGVVLDLRDNGGGLTHEAQKIADMFLPPNQRIYRLVGRAMGKEDVVTREPAEFPSLPLALIINGNSASASEILASSLQAHHRARIVGWPSYGKGTVQRIYPVTDGSVKITVAHYLSADLTPIDKKGVMPDVVVSGEDPGFRPSRFIKDPAREAAIAEVVSEAEKQK